MSDPGWSVSLNEVESISVKAARGAGAGWGVAEDVARAARWMAARQLDWSGRLLALLDRGAVSARLGPILRVADLLSGARPGDAWRLEACAPVWALAILSAALHGRDLVLDLGPVVEGIAPAPARPSSRAGEAEPGIHSAAPDPGFRARLRRPGMTAAGLVRLSADVGVSADRERTFLDMADPQDILVTVGVGLPPLPHVLPGGGRRSLVPHAAWQALDAYAARTYVAPTAQSRATGAGGGRVDAD